MCRAWRREPGEDPQDTAHGPVVDGSDPMRVYVIEVDGDPAGLIQSFRHADEPEVLRCLGMPDAAGIDYLIGPAAHRGRGVGTAAIHAFSTLVLGFYPEVTGIVAAPLARNRASCRALEKAGFQREGYARSYLCINGVWQDHLLYARLKDDPD